MGRDARLRKAGIVQPVVPEPVTEPAPEPRKITGDHAGSILRLAAMMTQGRPIRDPLPLTLSPILRARMREAQQQRKPLVVSDGELQELQKAGVIPAQPVVTSTEPSE